MIRQIINKANNQQVVRRTFCTYFEKRNNNTPYSTDPIVDVNEKKNNVNKYFETYSKHKTYVSFLDKNSITTPAVKGLYPRSGLEEFVAPSASVIGNVNLGNCSSVWDHCVLKADVNYIHIGNFTNIQDGTVIREATEPLSIDHNGSTIIGDNVTIGHGCILEACTVEENCLIGMGSILEPESYVEAYSIVGASSIVTKGTRIKSGQLWVGKPAKFVRELSEQEIIDIGNHANSYVLNAEQARASFNLDNDSFLYAQAEEQGISVGWKGEYFPEAEEPKN
ncbi:hypothetical protein DICPUDRAFT_159433 [Dictyostelium purpureum]|uniref:Uncharacterized protein n=1 Tax=Dictyostelium purpureum TaxID=5786 RepID=F1A443_DICPU|nr:uncharacterized protein DICPUDRAFT_159433 [Dictyostelium purpureum]EGC29040.1 hypothetical protein DICPUDRAFT_159433 [Dictyostelium purpureum]|eukprot:XP_003294438.1 hypothetical protein DICPUDRAFT_159433 [Dictyostelium purpureum]